MQDKIEMKTNPFSTLPNHLKKYILKFGWDESKINEWLLSSIPALGGRCIVQALSDGALLEVNKVVLRVGDTLGIEDSLDA